LDSETCFACRLGDPDCPIDQDILQCYFDFQDNCPTEEDCQTRGGSCSDEDLSRSSGICSRDNVDRPLACDDACVFDYVWNEEYALVECPQNSLASFIGCTSIDFNDEETCLAAGGTWYSRAYNEETCESRFGYGCLEEEFPSVLSNKNKEQCRACGGEYQKRAQWNEAYWKVMDSFPLFWIEAKYATLNTFEPMLDFNKLEAGVTEAVGDRLKLAFQSEIMCQINPLANVLRTIACDCSTWPEDEHEQESFERICNSRFQGIQSLDVGRQLVCYGTDDQATFGTTGVSVSPNTIPQELGCIQVAAARVPVSQFKDENVDSLSSLSLSSAGSNRVDNEYAVVENEFDRQVGLLRGDGTNFKFERFNAQGKRVSGGQGNINNQEKKIY